MTAVYVAAGSNVDAARNLRLALAELERRFGPLKVSRAYRNKAFGFEGPDFTNLAVGFETGRDLHAVIGELHAIEALCGRERQAPKWGPRRMDLDILLFGDLVCQEPDLKLPRPHLLTQAYMLGPLTEIAGHVHHPVLGTPLDQLWEAFDRNAHPLTPVDIFASDP